MDQGGERDPVSLPKRLGGECSYSLGAAVRRCALLGGELTQENALRAGTEAAIDALGRN